MTKNQVCGACHKVYSSKYNLKAHMTRQPLCGQWLKLQPGIKDYVDDKFMLPMTDIDKKEANTVCRICCTTFANTGNLNRHLETNVMCSKWMLYKDLKPLEDYQTHLKDASFNNAFLSGTKEIEEPGIEYVDFAMACCRCGISFKSVVNESEQRDDHTFLCKTCRECSNSDNQSTDEAFATYGQTFEAFHAPAYSLCHIIWNVFLIDREFVAKVDLAKVVEENNVKFILAIVPNEEAFTNTVQFDIAHELILYTDHDMTLDIERFDALCHTIESYRSAKERANVIVFCNAGFQRSIPFLCYYLMVHHKNEVPNVTRAIDMILPQVDKANYATTRDGVIENVTKLFTQYGLA